MIAKSKKVVLVLTIEKALEWGLLFCVCGHPPNNHFDFEEQICAHCSEGKCPGLKDPKNLMSREGIQLFLAAA